MKPIVCLFVCQRHRIVDKWLQAWHRADKHDAKLVVFHIFNPKKWRSFPSVDQMQMILDHKPDYYIPKVGWGGNTGAFQEFLIRHQEFPPWGAVLCFDDDTLPMRKNFLGPFLKRIQKPQVGLVGAFFEPPRPRVVPHIRTGAFCLRREVAMALKFPPNLLQDSDKRFLFESGIRDNMYSQVRHLGYKVEVANGDMNTPWCEDQSIVWDVDHCFNHNLWDKFHEEFELDRSPF